jgi:hypothetical protein
MNRQDAKDATREEKNVATETERTRRREKANIFTLFVLCVSVAKTSSLGVLGG